MEEIEFLLIRAKAAGFQKVGFVNTQHLISILEKAYPFHPQYKKGIITRINSCFNTDILCKQKPSIFLLCALSTYRKEQDDPGPENSVYGLIAPFARRNFYQEAITRLKKLCRELREEFGFSRQETRIFSNSRCPEKFLAWASGLGFYGKNSLIISKELGSHFIIAGVMLPWHSPLPNLELRKKPVVSECGLCRACILECPTGAIKEGGVIDENLCIQALSTKLIPLSETIKKAFGYMIYGCQTCQAVCPYNKKLSFQTLTAKGELGPAIPLHTLLERSPSDIRTHLKKTVLGLSWIHPEALQRNALIASGNRKNPAIRASVEPFLRHSNHLLQEAARWALARLV